MPAVFSLFPIFQTPSPSSGLAEEARVSDADVSNRKQKKSEVKNRQEKTEKTARSASDLETEPDMLELSPSDTLLVCGNNLELSRMHSPNSFKIAFNHFNYVQFVRCLKDLCLFMSLPNANQYESLLKFFSRSQEINLQKSDFEKRSSKLTSTLAYVSRSLGNNSVEQEFDIHKFLLLNLPLLFAYGELHMLLN